MRVEDFEALKERVFQQVAEHLLTQMTRSSVCDSFVTNSVECLYRGPDGTKCAVGGLITDENYQDSMEGVSVEFDVVLDAVILSLGHKLEDFDVAQKEILRKFLSDLQNIHDDYEPDEWAGKLRAFAESNNYRVPEMI